MDELFSTDNHRTARSLEDRSVLKREEISHKIQKSKSLETTKLVEDETRNRSNEKGQLLSSTLKNVLQSSCAYGMCKLPLDQYFPVKLLSLWKYEKQFSVMQWDLNELQGTSVASADEVLRSLTNIKRKAWNISLSERYQFIGPC